LQPKRTKTPNDSNDDNEWLHMIGMVQGLTHGDEKLTNFDGKDN